MFLKGHGHQFFIHQGVWLIIRAHAPLFHDDFNFFAEFSFGQMQVAHTIRFKLHSKR